MRDVNEDSTTYGGVRRTDGESIERGSGGLSVSDLLAKVITTPTAQPGVTSGDANGAGGTGPRTGSASPPRTVDGLAAAIAAEAGRHLSAGHLSPDTDFFDAGGTSVHVVELAAALERELGMTIALDDVFADARPRALAARWLKATGASEAPEPSGPAEVRSAAPDVRPVPVPASRGALPPSAAGPSPSPPPRLARRPSPPPLQ